MHVREELIYFPYFQEKDDSSKIVEVFSRTLDIDDGIVCKKKVVEKEECLWKREKGAHLKMLQIRKLNKSPTFSPRFFTPRSLPHSLFPDIYICARYSHPLKFIKIRFIQFHTHQSISRETLTTCFLFSYYCATYTVVEGGRGIVKNIQI